MTTIIVSILAALGIGGGVMLASSGGGGGSSGGAAVVAPVNPGDSGGSSYTGGGSSGGGTSYYGSINAGNMLKSTSDSNIKIVAKNTQVEKSIAGAGLTIDLTVMAPNKISDGIWQTNEVYTDFVKSYLKYVSGYSNVNPKVQATFNLSQISSSSAVADFYDLPSQTKYLGTLNTTILHYFSSLIKNTYENVSWTFKPTLALGGRKFDLKHSDFGYYVWYSKYSNTPNTMTDSHFYRYGTQQLYMFDTSKQLKNNYQARYGNTANFAGVAIGALHQLNDSCGKNAAPLEITGNINLALNFANNKLSGNVALHSVSDGKEWYTLTLGGTINNVSGSGQNFNINSVTLSGDPSFYAIDKNSTKPLVSTSSYGGGVIVEGSSVSADEMVGEIAFINNEHNSCLFSYTNLAFGAKKQ